MQKKKLIALFAGLSLAFVGSAALAAPSADTLLVAGYDSEEMAVLYGVSGIDQDDDTTATLDCTLDGTFGYTVEDETADVTRVDSLTSVDQDSDPDTPDDTTFEPETVITNPDNPELDDVDYGLPGAEECDLTSVAVDRDGEVNHGSVVSTFANLLDGGKGCIIRHFAQSDFGKDSYEGTGNSFEVILESIATSCEKGKDRVSGDEESPGNGKVKGLDKDKGRPEHAGPPAHAKGKKNGS